MYFKKIYRGIETKMFLSKAVAAANNSTRKKAYPPAFAFFDTRDFLMDQKLLLQQALRQAILHMQMKCKMSLVVHHLICFYEPIMRDQKNSNDRNKGLNMAACQMLQRLAQTLRSSASEDVMSSEYDSTYTTLLEMYRDLENSM